MPLLSQNNTIEHSSLEILKNTNFIPGEFKYVKNSSDRKMLTTAYKAIEITENWHFIKNYEGNIMISNHSIDLILNKIMELGYISHSGVSFNYILKTMKFIANNGEEEFMKKILS